jgi:hypothetical protein
MVSPSSTLWARGGSGVGVDVGTGVSVGRAVAVGIAVGEGVTGGTVGSAPGWTTSIVYKP